MRVKICEIQLTEKSYLTILHTCSFVSVPLNLFAIFCIIWKSPIEMKENRWYLLNLQIWVFVSDFFFFALSAPRFYLPFIAGSMHGLLENFSVSYEIQIIFGFGLSFGMISACAHIVQYRHLQIIPFNRFLYSHKNFVRGLNIIRYLLLCLAAIPTVLMEPKNQLESKLNVAKNATCIPSFFLEDKVHILQETPTLVACQGIATITYISIEMNYYIYKSFDLLKSDKASNMSLAIKKLQRIYLTSLCIQVFVPIICCFIPFGFLMYSLSVNSHNSQIWTDLSVILIGAHGIIATLITLIIYRPYRDFTKKLILCDLLDK